MQKVNLGTDEGLVEFKIGDKEFVVCPETAISQIHKLAGVTGDSEADSKNPNAKGIAFLDFVRQWLSEKHGVTPVSTFTAKSFYESLIENFKRIDELFSQRLDSSSTTESTPAV